MWRYIGATALIILVGMATIWLTMILFEESLIPLLSAVTGEDLSDQVILAISLPLSTLLPLLFSFIKALDLLYERIDELQKARGMTALLTRIRQSTESERAYPILERDWPSIYQLQRDQLIRVESTPDGWQATYKKNP